MLLSDGKYLTVEKCENETQPCPDIGSLANGSKGKLMFWQKKSSVILFAPEKERVSSAKNEFLGRHLRMEQEVQVCYVLRC